MIAVAVLGAALLVGATLLVLLVRGWFFGYPLPAIRSRILSRKEQAIVAACADTLFPAGGAIPLSGTEAGLVAYVDDDLGVVSPRYRRLIRLLYVFIEHGPWIFGPRRRRFTLLALEERMAVLRDMAQSPVYFRRLAFLSMRAMLCMGYLANTHVAAKLGSASNRAPFAAPKTR